MKISQSTLKQIILEEIQAEMQSCPEVHEENFGEVLVAYDATGKEVMRSKVFTTDDEKQQLHKLRDVLQQQDLVVEIVPASGEERAVSIEDEPGLKIISRAGYTGMK